MKEIPLLLYHNVGDYPLELMEEGISPHALFYDLGGGETPAAGYNL